MPRAKKIKEVVSEPVVEVKEEVVAPVVESNENVKVVNINGRLYNQIFNPADGTTRVELIV